MKNQSDHRVIRARFAKVGLIVSLAVLVVGVAGSNRELLPTWTATAASAPAVERDPSRVPALVVTATPAGFNPLEIRVRPGQRRLLIRTGTGIENPQFIVTRPDRVPVFSGSSRRGRLFCQVVTLIPGELIVTELAHPTWECRIIVEP